MLKLTKPHFSLRKTEPTRRGLCAAAPSWAPKTTPSAPACTPRILLKPKEFAYMSQTSPLRRSTGLHKHFVSILQEKTWNH